MVSVSESTLLRIVRTSAWYDLVTTAPFTTPWAFALLHQALSTLAHVLGMGGSPTSEPTHLPMASPIGSVVCVWSVLRIRRPSVALDRCNTVARGLSVAWQACALASGATLLLILFLTAEVDFRLL